MKNKEQKLKNLFDEWKNDTCFNEEGKKGQFVPDGIVDYEEFEKAEIKVLFLLRDAHDVDGNYEEHGICDEVLHSKNSYKTWGPIAIWARGVLYLEEPFADLNQLKKESYTAPDDNGIRKYYRKIAIMNLKKVSGGANAENIEEFAERHAENIHREIEIIAPDIIVACGNDVYDLLIGTVYDIDLRNAVENKIDLSEKMKHYGHCIKLMNGNSDVLVIRYRHPAMSGRSGGQESHFQNMQIIRKYYENTIK